MSTLIINRKLPAPVFYQIRDQVIRMISEEVMKPGDRMPSIYGLAKELALSPMTVRQAYSELEKAGMIEMRHGSGTYVRASALTSVQSEVTCAHDIALLVPSLARTASFTLGILKGIGEECATNGTNLHVFSSGNEWSRRINGDFIRNIVASGHLSGFLIAGPLYCDDVDFFCQLNLPFVLLDNDYDGEEDIPMVVINDEAAAQMLIRQAISAGRKRIAMIAGPGSENGQIIRRGDKLAKVYREMLGGADMIRFAEYSPVTGKRLAEELLALPKPPDAIIVNGDPLAMGVLEACDGRDVMVINYGDTEGSLCAGCTKPLLGMGREAMRMLSGMLRGAAGGKRCLEPLEKACVN